VSALALLVEAAEAGLALRAEDARLHWRAEVPLAPNLLVQLRWHKADLAATAHGWAIDKRRCAGSDRTGARQ
jgi:hypothetical protein